MSDEASIRNQILAAKRVVVKLGSRVLVQPNGEPDMDQLTRLVDAVAELRRLDRDVVVVTSGAVGAGMEALGWQARPTNVPDLQMAAAVGQSRLMARYDQLFAERNFQVGQVLLTHSDLRDRRRHLNARNTMMNLLRHGIVPIVNENDVVAVEEVTFGDNDMLAALVAVLTQADLLILLTTTNGLHRDGPDGARERVPFLTEVNDSVLDHVCDSDSALSTGGMASKLSAAQAAADVGIPVVIADGREEGVLRSVLEGASVGTLLAGSPAAAEKKWSGRKQWIALFHRPEGQLVIDEGARHALLEQGKSLLPIGVREVRGNFQAGAVVDIEVEGGTVIARGLVDYSSEQIRIIQGQKTTEIERLLGRKDYDEVIHRDNLVVIQKGPAESTS